METDFNDPLIPALDPWRLFMVMKTRFSWAMKEFSLCLQNLALTQLTRYKNVKFNTYSLFNILPSIYTCVIYHIFDWNGTRRSRQKGCLHENY